VFVVLIPSTDSDSNKEDELGCVVPDVKLFSLRLPCLVVGHHCHDTFASQHNHLIFSGICCSLATARRQGHIGGAENLGSFEFSGIGWVLNQHNFSLVIFNGKNRVSPSFDRHSILNHISDRPKHSTLFHVVIKLESHDLVIFIKSVNSVLVLAIHHEVNYRGWAFTSIHRFSLEFEKY